MMSLRVMMPRSWGGVCATSPAAGRCCGWPCDRPPAGRSSRRRQISAAASPPPLSLRYWKRPRPRCLRRVSTPTSVRRRRAPRSLMPTVDAPSTQPLSDLLDSIVGLKCKHRFRGNLADEDLIERVRDVFRRCFARRDGRSFRMMIVHQQARYEIRCRAAGQERQAAQRLLRGFKREHRRRQELRKAPPNIAAMETRAATPAFALWKPAVTGSMPEPNRTADERCERAPTVPLPNEIAQEINFITQSTSMHEPPIDRKSRR